MIVVKSSKQDILANKLTAFKLNQYTIKAEYKTRFFLVPRTPNTREVFSLFETLYNYY